MNICAGGATGLSGAKAALVGKRSVAQAKAWAGGVAEAGAKAANRTVPLSATEQSPCLVLQGSQV